MRYSTIGLISKDLKEYPANLAGLAGSPRKLYIKGKILPKDQRAIAIVGTRNPSAYGRNTARLFAKALAQAGITVISGLARGIDTVAHCSALDAGGRTIAVLGSGLDTIYPPENKFLARRIEDNGALVSEYAKGVKPVGKNFLARNRIISGLSLGVLVVEGGERSGTLSTAAHAANQGREVYAIPGRVDNPTSFAPNFLIDNGAKIVRKPQDIFDILL